MLFYNFFDDDIFIQSTLTDTDSRRHGRLPSVSVFDNYIFARLLFIMRNRLFLIQSSIPTF